MAAFDPNSAGDGGIFGLRGTELDAALVLLPVPWEATTSYGSGASQGPAAILKASAQIDLFDPEVLKPYEPGIFMRPEAKEVRRWNKTAKAAAQKVIRAGGLVGGRPELRKALATANALGAKLNEWVYRESLALMKGGKIVGVVGGDHSVPLGAFQAATESYGKLGLLHFDAHIDMRDAYEGLRWSHASIMHNALTAFPRIEKIVQVGIRDFCEQEDDFVRSQGPRVRIFQQAALERRRFAGEPWDKVAAEIVDELPKQVWVTVDIDGLDPRFCPGTGTPVPGGLEFAELNRILAILAGSGRKILGFDLVEVAPSPGGSEWDANVGMRLLYKLAAWTFVSRGLRLPRQA